MNGAMTWWLEHWTTAPDVLFTLKGNLRIQTIKYNPQNSNNFLCEKGEWHRDKNMAIRIQNDTQKKKMKGVLLSAFHQ